MTGGGQCCMLCPPLYAGKDSFYGRYYCDHHSGRFNWRSSYIHSKSEEKWGKMHWMSGGRKLFGRREAAEEKAGRSCGRQEDNADLRNELCTLCYGRDQGP